jgi:hypothetical protein
MKSALNDSTQFALFRDHNVHVQLYNNVELISRFRECFAGTLTPCGNLLTSCRVAHKGSLAAGTARSADGANRHDAVIELRRPPAHPGRHRDGHAR